jgi:hypothetical protein
MLNQGEKTISKKIYALLLESSKTYFLSVQSAYSLEDAFLLAKIEFAKLNPLSKGENSLEGAKIGLFSIKTVEELNSQNSDKITSVDSAIQTQEETSSGRTVKIGQVDPEDFLKILEEGFLPKTRKSDIKKIIPKTPPEEESKTKKNKLMLEIIKSKDKRILEMNKELFTPEEIKYIEKQME